LRRSIHSDQTNERKTDPAATDDGDGATVAHVQNCGETKLARQELARYSEQHGQGQVEQQLTTARAVQQKKQRTVKPGDDERQNDGGRNGK
jgi:hypothetical protein